MGKSEKGFSLSTSTLEVVRHGKKHRSSAKPILVLGSTPWALLEALNWIQRGREVVIMQSGMDKLNLAQRLSMVALPMIDEEKIKLGTSDLGGYETSVWDLEEAYVKWYVKLAKYTVEPAGSWASVIGKINRDDWGEIISGIPAPETCAVLNGHRSDGSCKFEATSVVWTSEQIVQLPPSTWLVRAIGASNPSWLQAGNVFGESYVEWPAEVPPPVPNLQVHQWPASGGCSCWPWLKRVGYEAAWSMYARAGL